MGFCGQCGNKFEDGVKFCPSCGAPAAVSKQAAQQNVQVDPQPAAQPAAQQVDLGAKLQNFNNTVDSTADYDAADIQQNKTMSILAYFGPLVLIPIFAAKESKFARFHSNQGLLLLLAVIAYTIVYNILSSIILAISWRLYFLVTIIGLVSLVFLVLAIIGLLNAANGRAKELPFIGRFRLLK